MHLIVIPADTKLSSPLNAVRVHVSICDQHTDLWMFGVYTQHNRTQCNRHGTCKWFVIKLASSNHLIPLYSSTDCAVLPSTLTGTRRNKSKCCRVSPGVGSPDDPIAPWPLVVAMVVAVGPVELGSRKPVLRRCSLPRKLLTNYRVIADEHYE